MTRRFRHKWRIVIYILTQKQKQEEKENRARATRKNILYWLEIIQIALESSIKKGHESPLVSVCIPSFNNECSIAQTIDSILNQTYENIEIILIDNGSTDNTFNVMQKYLDKKIKIHRNDKNIGVVGNWNKCIEHATGKYVCIFHADDIYSPYIIEIQVKAFNESQDIAAVFTTGYLMDDKQAIIGEISLPKINAIQIKYNFDSLFNNILSHGNFLVCPSAMVKKEVYDNIGKFTDEYASCLDTDMWFRILKKYPIMVINKKLLLYRIGSIHTKVKKLIDRRGLFSTNSSCHFQIMDVYLNKYKNNGKKIQQIALIKYEISKMHDEIRRVESYMMHSKYTKSKLVLTAALNKVTLTNIFKHKTNFRDIFKYLYGLMVLCLLKTNFQSILKPAILYKNRLYIFHSARAR